MSEPAPLPFRSATEIAAAIRERKVGCEEMLDAYLRRIEAFNPSINAVVHVDEEGARTRARAADNALAKRDLWGPLHGVPMTVKESFAVRGWPTTFGFAAFRDNIAQEDAEAVRRLRNSGAIIFGKTNVPPALADGQSDNEVYGRTNNPWNLERSPGGSSGGSAAALAAGLTAAELGSDIASSIRNPAHYCGLFGHKPTYELCPSLGHSLLPRLAPTDVSVIGPLARSAADLELMLGILAGPNPPESDGFRLHLPRCEKDSFASFRIGLVTNDAYAWVASDVEKQLHKLAGFLQQQGAVVDIGARPDLDSREVHQVYETLIRAALSYNLSDADFEGALVEKENPPSDLSDMRRFFLEGATMSHRDWLMLNERRLVMRNKWLQFFEQYDLLLCPAIATTAPPHSDQPPIRRMIMVDDRPMPFGRQLFWGGYAGGFYLPATVAPIGFSADRLPVGVQIIGRPYGDLECIRFARLLERHYCAFSPPPQFA